MENDVLGTSVGEYTIYFRNGLELLIDAMTEDKLVRSKNDIFLIMKYVIINKNIINRLMKMSDRRIDKIEFKHEFITKGIGEYHLVKSNIGNCEMISFMIENECKSSSTYRIVIKANAKFVDLYNEKEN